MRDLERFGKALQQLREGRGITQDQVLDRSSAYKDASSLRKIERGERRPKRHVLIILLTKGLEETDPLIIDNLLNLAGYAPLSEREITTSGLLKRQAPLPLDRDVNPGFDKKAPVARLSRNLIRVWNFIVAISTIVFILLGWGQDWFAVLCCVLYAGLYAISVLLESAYEFRGADTVRAALLACSTVAATSLAAILVDAYSISVGRSDGLWYALLIFVLAAVLQWVLVRPALSAQAIVQTSFQTHTAQAAHLKNTGYFLLLVVLFWLPPRHCVLTGTRAAQTALHSAFCPRPEWLLGILILMLVVSLPMGSRLLENLKSSPRHNLYVNLFYARAVLYFLLSTICLMWYSSH